MSIGRELPQHPEEGLVGARDAKHAQDLGRDVKAFVWGFLAILLFQIPLSRSEPRLIFVEDLFLCLEPFAH